MSAGHAHAFDLLAPISGDVEDAAPLAIQVGAEDVDRTPGRLQTSPASICVVLPDAAGKR
jgi:hypothetical protein